MCTISRRGANKYPILTELDRASHPIIRTQISLNKMARRDMEEEVAEVDSLNRVIRGTWWRRMSIPRLVTSEIPQPSMQCELGAERKGFRV